MDSIERIGRVSPVWQALEIGATGKAARRTAPNVHPYWQALNERVASVACDSEKFRLLTDLAQGNAGLAMLEGEPPEPTLLRLHEHAVRAWMREQPPATRGRLYRLLMGASVETPWPHHVLQREGRFSARWQIFMCEAARAYVQAVAADAAAMTALQPLQQPGGDALLGPQARHALATRLMAHAAHAWGVPAVRVIVHANACDTAEGSQVAQTHAVAPPCVAFYPLAFAEGAIELMATAFHECVHVVQMGRLREGWRSELIEEAHADVLDLSFEHLRARHRLAGSAYALYRHGAEIEREAHLAGLQVAVVAAALPAFGASGGTLWRIAQGARDAGLRDDPQAAVLSLVQQETALRIADVSGAAAQAAEASLRTASTRDALAARANASPDEAAFERVLAACGTTSPEAERTWRAMLQLQRLRDPADRASVVAQAVMSAAPEVFYSGTDESEFLHGLVSAALDANAPPLLDKAWALLAHRFGRLAGQGQRLRLLQAAWYGCRSPLSRRVIAALARQRGPSGTAAPPAPLNPR